MYYKNERPDGASKAERKKLKSWSRIEKEKDREGEEKERSKVRMIIRCCTEIS